MKRLTERIVSSGRSAASARAPRADDDLAVRAGTSTADGRSRSPVSGCGRHARPAVLEHGDEAVRRAEINADDRVPRSPSPIASSTSPSERVAGTRSRPAGAGARRATAPSPLRRQRPERRARARSPSRRARERVPQRRAPRRAARRRAAPPRARSSSSFSCVSKTLRAIAGGTRVAVVAERRAVQLEPVAPARHRIAQRAVGAVHRRARREAQRRARARRPSDSDPDAPRATRRGSGARAPPRSTVEPARQAEDARRGRVAGGNGWTAAQRAHTSDARGRPPPALPAIRADSRPSLRSRAMRPSHQTTNDEPQPQRALDVRVPQVEARAP